MCWGLCSSLFSWRGKTTLNYFFKTNKINYSGSSSVQSQKLCGCNFLGLYVFFGCISGVLPNWPMPWASGMKGQNKAPSKIYTLYSSPFKKPEKAESWVPHSLTQCSRGPGSGPHQARLRTQNPSTFLKFLPSKTNKQRNKNHTKKDQTSECQDYRYRHVVKEAAPSRHWWHWLRVSALSSTCSVTGRAGEVTGTLSFSQTRVHAALALRKTELCIQQMMWLWPFCHLHLIVWNTVIGTCWSLMRINKPEFDFNCRADRSSMTCKTHQEQSKVKCWKAVCELESWEILDFNDFRFEDVSFPQIIQKLKSTDLQNKPAFTILRGKHHRLPYSAETLQFKISQNTCSSL